MRPQNMSGTPLIPVDRIYWYADRVLRIDARDLDAWVWIMREVDGRFVTMAREREKAAQ